MPVDRIVLGQAEFHLTGLAQDDVTRILPDVIAVLGAGWRNVRFEVGPALVLWAEHGPLMARYQVTLGPDLSVADGARFLLGLLAVLQPPLTPEDWPYRVRQPLIFPDFGGAAALGCLAPGSVVDFEDPPLTDEQWRGLRSIGEVLRDAGTMRLSTQPHEDHWTDRALAPVDPVPTLDAESARMRRSMDAVEGLAWNHLRRAREILERAERPLPLRQICCGQPMVECDFGNALKCETCQRVVRRRLHGQHSPQGWVDRRAPEEVLADHLPWDGDPGLADRVQTLLDLARAGQEADFKFLAGAVGVPAGDLEALWTGTVARLRSQDKGDG